VASSVAGFARRHALAILWGLYLGIVLGLNLAGEQGPAAKSVSLLFLPLLVATGILAKWWKGILMWAALTVLFAAMGTPLDVTFELGLGTAGPALGGFLFGLLFLGLGRLARLGYDHAKRAGRLQAEAEASRAREAQLALLLKGAAHEIANPLTPIQLQLKVALMASSGEARESLLRIQRSTKRLERLARDFQDAARSLGGPLNIEVADVDLAPLLRDVAMEQADVMRQAGLTFTSDMPATLVCRCDAGRIVQCVVNLCQNAVRYTPKGGHIRLVARRDGANIVITVTDSGLGLTTDQAAQLFQPLVRFHPDAAQGLGIGLWLVKGILSAHGGHAEAQSPGPGQGSTFTLRWPSPADG
jgi:signal transduction histidine kinase